MKKKSYVLIVILAAIMVGVFSTAYAQDGEPKMLTGRAAQEAMLEFIPPNYPPANAVEYYVDDDAEDYFNDCLTPETACRTIVEGLRKVVTGEPSIVNVAAGSYTLPASEVDPWGFALNTWAMNAGTALVGAGWDKTFIDMDDPENQNIEGASFHIGNPDDHNGTDDLYVIEGFSFVGRPGTWEIVHAIEHRGTGTLIVRNNRFTGYDWGVITHCGSVCDMMTIVSNNVFDGLKRGVAYGYFGSGVPYAVYNNVFINNELALISGRPDNFVQNNVFEGNDVAVWAPHPYPQFLSYNAWYGNVVDLDTIASTKGIGSINVDPLLDEEYRPMYASPAIDAGNPDPSFNDPDGSRNDIGAYGGPDAVSNVSILKVTPHAMVTNPLTDTQHIVDYVVGITARNVITAENVIVTMTLPAGLNYISSSITGTVSATVIYDAGSHVVVFEIGEVVEMDGLVEAHVFMEVETVESAAFYAYGQVTWHEGEKEFSAVAITNPFATFLPIIQKE